MSVLIAVLLGLLLLLGNRFLPLYILLGIGVLLMEEVIVAEDEDPARGNEKRSTRPGVAPRQRRAIGCAVALVLLLPAIWFLKVNFFPISDAQIEKARNAKRTLAPEDTLYESPDGFSILIPAGHEYVPIESGPFSIFVSKPPCRLEITKWRWRVGDLKKIVTAQCDGLRKRGVSYTPLIDLDLGAAKGLRCEFSFTTPNGVVRAIEVWFKIGSTMYQGVFNCPEWCYASAAPEYETMLKTLRVK